jgi:hypothetical protein
MNILGRVHMGIPTIRLTIIRKIGQYIIVYLMFDHTGQQIVTVCEKFRERLAVNKQTSHRFHMESFTLKKLNEVEGKGKFRVEVSKRFATLEDLD